MDQFKTIIVDDVRLIRKELKNMLNKYPNIQVVGEASNGEEAIQLISEVKPDLVFLDIHLPKLSGFDLLDRIDVDFKVIFISSFYDKFSAKAQHYNPVDFLMKPINKEKLSRAIGKITNLTVHKNI